MVYYQRSHPKGHCGIAETPKTQQSFQSIAHERPGRKELHRVDDSHIQAVMLQYASVAQGIEQWFPVPCVGGSNPSRCVSFYIFPEERKKNQDRTQS